MTPQPTQPTKWWQILITTAANLGIAILTAHFFGPTAAVGTAIGGGMVQHTLKGVGQ